MFEVHDLWPLSPMELGGMSKWHPFIMLVQAAENYAYCNADLVISMLPKVREYMERTKEQARTQGYVESLMGRRRYFPELQPGSHIPIGMRNQQEREAINMPIQGTAADIIKKAMIEIDHELYHNRKHSVMTLQVHDELVLECPAGEVDALCSLAKQKMESAYTLSVKLRADVAVGKNWDEVEG